MKFKNVLVVRKTPKINFLMSRYDISKIKRSPEYETLKLASSHHDENSETFIKALQKLEKNHYNKLDVVNDFYLIKENKSQEDIDIEFNDYDLIFSLGGDGTFLRTNYFIKNNNTTTLIGVNTDSDFSVGHFCSLNKRHIDNNLESNLIKIFKGDTEERLLDRGQVTLRDNKENYYFLNDIYFGEKHFGSVSKFELTFNDYENLDVRATGIICSTKNGLTGWIKNANNISKEKFDVKINELETLNNKSLNLTQQEKIEMYENCSQHQSGDNNSVYFYVREPFITSTMKGNFKNEQEYRRYLNGLEGVTDNISIKNLGFDAFFIIDGFFERNIRYNEIFRISTSNEKLKTIYRL